MEKDAIVNEHRFEAYKDVLREYDMKLIQEDILHTKLRADKAYSGMLDYLKGKVLEELPTAFYCANDVTAIGVMKAIRETGFSIPGDIAVVGLDDVDMASYVTPPLTTVKIQKEELGRTAAKILVDKIESGRDYPSGWICRLSWSYGRAHSRCITLESCFGRMMCGCPV